MSGVSVKQLAEVLSVSVERLLGQLDKAGMSFESGDQTVSDEEKMKLLNFLRDTHGGGEVKAAEPKKITLRRKTVAELKQPAGSGRGATRGKTVNVEVRKKRTYMKRSEVVSEEAEKLKAETDKIAREREEAERAAELERQRRADASEAKAREEEARKAEAEARKREEEEALKQAAAAAAAPPVPPPAEKSEKRGKRGDKHGKAEKETKYGRKELHVDASKSGRRKKKPRRAGRSAVSSSSGEHGFEMPVAPVVRDVSIPETITVGELAQK
ncbi:MAG TPA: translation initiation factor IF-2, partial [Gammaproteobacteria bacterium]|nr:translation initiation factor IF-2 [Gammaproteobacteria bacterium]